MEELCLENNKSIVENARMLVKKLISECCCGQIVKYFEYQRGFFPSLPHFLPLFLSWELGVNLRFLKRGVTWQKLVCEKVNPAAFFMMD